jgi:hypothetical protein
MPLINSPLVLVVKRFIFVYFRLPDLRSSLWEIQGEFTDATIDCIERDAFVFNVHKVIFSCFSPVFRTMFRHSSSLLFRGTFYQDLFQLLITECLSCIAGDKIEPNIKNVNLVLLHPRNVINIVLLLKAMTNKSFGNIKLLNSDLSYFLDSN